MSTVGLGLGFEARVGIKGEWAGAGVMVVMQDWLLREGTRSPTSLFSALLLLDVLGTIGLSSPHPLHTSLPSRTPISPSLFNTLCARICDSSWFETPQLGAEQECPSTRTHRYGSPSSTANTSFKSGMEPVLIESDMAPNAIEPLIRISWITWNVTFLHRGSGPVNFPSPRYRNRRHTIQPRQQPIRTDDDAVNRGWGQGETKGGAWQGKKVTCLVGGRTPPAAIASRG